MTTTTDIVSIGKACSIVQAMPEAIHRAAERLGIEVTARIDGREYYTAPDVERIGREIHAQYHAERQR